MKTFQKTHQARTQTSRGVWRRRLRPYAPAGQRRSRTPRVFPKPIYVESGASRTINVAADRDGSARRERYGRTARRPPDPRLQWDLRAPKHARPSSQRRQDAGRYLDRARDSARSSRATTPRWPQATSCVAGSHARSSHRRRLRPGDRGTPGRRAGAGRRPAPRRPGNGSRGRAARSADAIRRACRDSPHVEIGLRLPLTMPSSIRYRSSSWSSTNASKRRVSALVR